MVRIYYKNNTAAMGRINGNLKMEDYNNPITLTLTTLGLGCSYEQSCTMTGDNGITDFR